MARRLALVASRNRWVPVVYIVTCFYVLPFLLILVLG
jgi:hypothetical protein